MMKITHIWQEAAIKSDDSLTVSFTIEQPDERDRQNLWYRLPLEYSNYVTSSCDPFLVAYILPAMNQSTNLMIHGEISPSLLQNIAEFQIFWNCWRPEKYHIIDISAEAEKESEVIDSDAALCTFSGGVDSCFTASRHAMNHCGRVRRNVQGGVMVHGYDIPLEQEEVFESAKAKAHKILHSINLELIPIVTNYRKIIFTPWEDAYGGAIASALMLLKKKYTTGLLASAFPYQNLMLPRGSNPVSDQFLCSKTFQFFHDGAGFNRLQKIEEISQWQEALENLRVCWEGKQLDRNCGVCEKCIRTLLGFRVMGIELPPCFPQDISDSQIENLKATSAIKLAELELIWETAKKAQISASWVNSLEICIQRNRQRNGRLAVWDHWKNQIKQQLPPPLVKKIENLGARFLKP
ncbi:MAG: hypothetical protein ACRCT1_22335 [Microcoleaceae cyanobacterium]|jgi:hypothetical protein